jgi:hypothetical protein
MVSFMFVAPDLKLVMVQVRVQVPKLKMARALAHGVGSPDRVAWAAGVIQLSWRVQHS